VKYVVAAIAGGLFALGLVVSGMTAPAKVTAFLDVGGNWDGSLAFVMTAAIAVYAPVAWLVRDHRRPIFDDRFHWPTPRVIDARLVGGAAIFGVGWGLSGYCPGPAIVSVGGGSLAVAVFAASMIVATAMMRSISRRA
jgi:uncharacterized membrane protein YedE/YeeE